jgi:copper chaperone NosL
MLFPLAMILVTACWEGQTTGPGEIHWDRQACERCQMVISDRQHAVQIRLAGKRQAHAFDDLGCALLWLDENGVLSNRSSNEEIWVRDSVDTQWVEGHSARFARGASTPMAYGFSVSDEGIALDKLRARIREIERRRRP